MPIVNSYQAAPATVADFAQDIGYVQEKARQVATQKAYTNHLAEINLRYQNQSELQRQAALQRAALTKQENEYREEFANKQMQRNLYSTAAELEMRSDYQSKIIAEQFKSNADMMKAREKIRKETQGWSYSDSAKRQQMEIKQQMQKIEQAENISPQDKRSELARLKRQLDTMVPDKEPENYVAPMTKYVDEDTGNLMMNDASGKPHVIHYQDGLTPEQYTWQQKQRDIELRAKNELNKIDRKYEYEKQIAAMVAQSKAQSGQIRQERYKQAQVKSHEIAATKIDSAIGRLNSDIAKLQSTFIQKQAELQKHLDNINNTDYTTMKDGKEVQDQDIADYQAAQAELKGIERMLSAKQFQRNDLNMKKRDVMQKITAIKVNDFKSKLKSGNESVKYAALSELKTAIENREPWAIEYLRQYEAEKAGQDNTFLANAE